MFGPRARDDMGAQANVFAGFVFACTRSLPLPLRNIGIYIFIICTYEEMHDKAGICKSRQFRLKVMGR